VWVTRWNLDPLTKGVYSTLAVGGTPADRRTLATAIGPRLALAGEYTSAKYPATMHGAFHSGEHAAAQLKVKASDHVIVVGAGIAGLTAARYLTNRLVRVTVLEATTQLGGRARIERRPSGTAFHSGAAWIHGTVGNPIADLARACGISFSAWPSSPNGTTHLQLGIGRLHDHQVREVEGLRDLILLSLRAQAGSSISAGDRDVTVRGPLRKELLAIVDPATRAAVAVLLQQHFESLMAGFLDDLSFLHGDEPFEYPGGDAYLTSAIAPMLEHLRGNQTVTHGVTVNNITYGLNGVTVKTDTETFTAEACIIATAVTPLQSKAIGFEPPLPAEHAQALSIIRMGHKAKLFVQFTTRWWGDLERIRVAPLSVNPDDPTDTSTIGNWIDASDVAGAPVLCGFIGGTEAIRLQRLSDEGLRAYVTNALVFLRDRQETSE
jgi:polyamine oxidase